MELGAGFALQKSEGAAEPVTGQASEVRYSTLSRLRSRQLGSVCVVPTCSW